LATMNTRFSACAAPAAVNIAARTASAIEKRMKSPPLGAQAPQNGIEMMLKNATIKLRPR
jgi:hypothetical protein